MKSAHWIAITDMKLWQKSALLIALPLLVELAIIAAIGNAQRELDRAYQAERECNQVAILTYQVLKLGVDATLEVAYFGGKHQDRVRTRFENLSNQIRELQAQLATYPNSSAQKLGPFIQNMDEQMHTLKESHQILEQMAAVAEASQLIAQVNIISREMLADQEVVHEQTLADLSRKQTNFQLLLIGGIVSSVALAAALAFLYNLDALNQLKVLTENAERFRNNQPLHDPLGGKGELAQLDQTFHSMVAERKELERLKQSFLAMVTHDLRSPLAANLSGLELLEQDNTLNESTQKILARMRSSNQRLLGLINDLLDMERLEAGLIDLDMELVSFQDLISECRVLLEPLYAAKRIELRVDDADALIYCDQQRMIQVFTNILSNAIKFSPEDTSIEIKLLPSDQFSIISIQDHGKGITPDFLPHLFDRFAQSGDKDSRRQGSGLGLAITKKLVEAHRGDIEVRSEIGVGTEFLVKLPKAPAST